MAAAPCRVRATRGGILGYLGELAIFPQLLRNEMDRKFSEEYVILVDFDST